MGISISGLEQLLFLKQNHDNDLHGSVLQLGRQDINFTPDVLQAYAEEFKVKLAQVPITVNPHTNNLCDSTLFASLGFQNIESMDVTNLEGATHVHDLNEPAPESLWSKYDMIYDGGTCEHVFDTHSFFRNIDMMLKPGGLVVHESPTNNFVNHGFYQLSPTLFDDVYSANNYEILEISMYYYLDPSQVLTHPPVRIPYARDSAPMVGKFPVLLATFVVARKPPHSNGFVKPYQGFYKRAFSLG